MNIDKSNILTDILLKESIDDISIIKPLCVKLEKLESELKSLSDGTRSEFLLTDGSDSTRYNNYYNLLVEIVTPDKDIIPDAETLSPAYLVFKNYEVILQWNRSLRFSLAVCTLKNKLINEL